MTVVIPSQSEHNFSPDDRREVVITYYCAPHGSRIAYLNSRGIKYEWFRRWRLQYFGGDIDRGITPRDNVVMTPKDSAEIKRLYSENTALKDELAKVKEELAQTREQSTAHAKAVDALGKAIATMQKYTEH